MSRIVVGFPPGQATDIVARLIAERIGPILGETFIVENRPGQGGSIALAQLAKTQADGRTLVLAPLASLVANPHLYKSVGYDTLKDFAPVTLVCDLPMLLVVNPSLPVKNVAELIAYAKANPDKIDYSSSGNGTLSHLGMEDFKRRAGISMLHVPYRGSAPAMTDLDRRRGERRHGHGDGDAALRPGRQPAGDRQRLFAAHRRHFRMRRRWPSRDFPASASRPGSASSRRPARRRSASTRSTPRSARSCNPTRSPRNSRRWA